MQKRIDRFKLHDCWSYTDFPTRIWDIFSEQGTPVRTTISEMGPVLLSRLMGLNDVQTGVMNIVFRVADEDGLLLLDLKDLRSMVNHVGENAKEYRLRYGNIAAASIGAIQRSLLALEDQGADLFFGEPALDLADWIRTSLDGRGYINILDSQKLINSPLVYSTFLLWLLSELYELMPEVGDLEKPRLVFFFDEAHLLFDDVPDALLDKVEQIVKLIRSKGVGVYFVTQNPADIPDSVLAQLGNKVQHALRAYTPKEQRAVRAAAESFRPNPEFDTEEAIMSVGTGEAVVSFLNEDGEPSVVEKCYILPPQSKMGTIDPGTRQQLVNSDELEMKYRESVDRESAYEILVARGEAQAALEAEALAAEEAEKLAAEEAKAQAAAEKEAKKLADQQAREEKARLKEEERLRKEAERAAANDPFQKVIRSAKSTVTSSVGRKIGNALVRGILGGLKR